MRQLGTAAGEHPERKIKTNDVLVTCTYKLGKRPSIPASEVENVRPCAYAGCQPRKAKRVGKTLFARHAIPVAYLRRYDSRRIHRTEINTPQTHLGPCPWGKCATHFARWSRRAAVILLHGCPSRRRTTTPGWLGILRLLRNFLEQLRGRCLELTGKLGAVRVARYCTLQCLC